MAWTYESSSWPDQGRALQGPELAGALLRCVAEPGAGAAEAALDFFAALAAVPLVERAPALRAPLAEGLTRALLAALAFPPGFAGWQEAEGDEDSFHRFRCARPGFRVTQGSGLKARCAAVPGWMAPGCAGLGGVMAPVCKLQHGAWLKDIEKVWEDGRVCGLAARGPASSLPDWHCLSHLPARMWVSALTTALPAATLLWLLGCSFQSGQHRCWRPRLRCQRAPVRTGPWIGTREAADPSPYPHAGVRQGAISGGGAGQRIRCAARRLPGPVLTLAPNPMLGSAREQSAAEALGSAYAVLRVDYLDLCGP